ncbi:MAG: ADP-ribosylation factor-like protein, partial [Candidatus Hodarchaeota archaeon]
MAHQISSFQEFLKKGQDALDANNYYDALTHLNVAKKILSEMVSAGVKVDDNQVKMFEELIVKVSNEYEKQKGGSSLFEHLRGSAPAGKKPNVLSLFLFGLDKAGKTTFVDYIKQEKFIDHAPTVGVDIKRITLGMVKFVFNDVGGQEAYRSKWKDYWHDPDVMVFMIDAADKARFTTSKGYLYSVINDPETKDIPLLILSNKHDIPQASEVDEIKDALDVKGIQGRVVSCLDISVKETTNIEKAMNFLASRALEDQELKKFVGKEVDRLNKSYGQLYVVFMDEAKMYDEQRKYDKAIDRVYKAKKIQEELFKQGFSKASKEISKCNTMLKRFELLA